MIIRNETPADFEAITHVTAEAFLTLAISQHTEQFIIQALREADALMVSLVAEINGQIVGHIAFSPVAMSDGTPGWHGLGPVSVLPQYQRQGIGRALIAEGLTRLKALGSRGCVLVGHPEYYKMLGFRNSPDLIHAGVPPEVFLVMPFYEKCPKGVVHFHEAFAATA